MIYDDATNLEEHAGSSTGASVTSVSAVSATASTAATYEKLDLLERTLHATGRVRLRYSEVTSKSQILMTIFQARGH